MFDAGESKGNLFGLERTTFVSRSSRQTQITTTSMSLHRDSRLTESTMSEGTSLLSQMDHTEKLFALMFLTTVIARKLSRIIFACNMRKYATGLIKVSRNFT